MDGTQLSVAIVGGTALLGSTTLPSVLSYLQTRATRAIVQGNGRGNVAEMGELALYRLEALAKRLSDHELKDHAVAARLHEGQELIREGQVAMLKTLKELGLLSNLLHDVSPRGKGQED